MVAYTGIETVSNMAEEAKDPGHDIPKAVNLVLLAVLGVYAGISVVALSALAGGASTPATSRLRWAPPTRTTPCSGSSPASACTARS